MTVYQLLLIIPSKNSGAEGVKHKYPPHQSLVPPTLIIESRGTSITNNTTVVVSSKYNNNTNNFLIFVK